MQEEGINYESFFPCDEPIDDANGDNNNDQLERKEICNQIAKIALGCDTPMVIGVYGGWGSGKSSMMKMIKNSIENKAKTIEFNPWEYQFSDNIPLLLIQHIAKECGILNETKAKDALASIIKATPDFVASIVGHGLPLATKAITKGTDYFINKMLDSNNSKLELLDSYKGLIKKALDKSGKRLIIFIDDLDRCLPEPTLRLLEALKLYLRHKDCVFILGMAPDAVAACIDHHYKDSPARINGHDYLEKIIQIPFKVPGVSKSIKTKYIEKLLGAELQSCNELLSIGLSENPREMKRFILLLKMNYLAGKKTHKDYRTETAAFILLIHWLSLKENEWFGDSKPSATVQSNGEQKAADMVALVVDAPEPSNEPMVATPLNLSLFERISSDKQLLINLVSNAPWAEEQRKLHLGRDERLISLFDLAMKKVYVPRDEDEVALYIHLAKGETGTNESSNDDKLEEMFKEHEEWLLSGGTRGKQIHLLRGQYDHDKECFIKRNLSQAYLFGIFMEWSDLTETKLYGANMEEAALSGINLTRADLRHANLRGADLKKACFKSAKMEKTQLWLADLSDGCLNNADMRHAYLERADMTGAFLKGANLFGANLKMVDLTNANLTNANLENANLAEADFKDAILTGCNLSGAYLKGAKNLDEGQLRDAKRSKNFVWIDNNEYKCEKINDIAEGAESAQSEPYWKDL